MDITKAMTMLSREMQKHGLIEQGWGWSFNNRKSSLGLCKYVSKTIFLSRPMVEINSEEIIANTILHEIAHALCDKDAGHGPEWKRMAIKVGARPERCTTLASSVPGRYVAICPIKHGEIAQLYKRPIRNREYYCTACKRVGRRQPVIIKERTD